MFQYLNLIFYFILFNRTMIILRKIVMIFLYLGIGFLSCVGNIYFIQQLTLLNPLYSIYIRVFYFSLKENFGFLYHRLANSKHLTILRHKLGLVGICIYVTILWSIEIFDGLYSRLLLS